MIDVYPPQDALAVIEDESLGNGGGPYNLLKDLSKMEVRIPLTGVGLVGEDSDGEHILNDCKNSAIDCELVKVTNEAPTSYTDVMSVKSTGRRTFFHQRGANALLNESHFDLSKSNAWLLHLAYLNLLDSLDIIDDSGYTGATHVLKKARELGMKTSIDLVSVESDMFNRVIKPSLPFVNYFLLNEIEAERIADIQIVKGEEVDLESVGNAAEKLIEMGIGNLVVIHYPDGALAMDTNGKKYVQGSLRVSTEEIKGTVGAGDSFAAGMLYGLHEDWPIDKCLNLAVCVSASCLYDATTSGGILPLNECLALGEKYGYRKIV